MPFPWSKREIPTRPSSPPIDEPREVSPTFLELVERELSSRIIEPNDALYDKWLAEHRDQMAGFTLRPERHGDFLTLFITRKANPANHQKSVVSVNLSKITKIVLYPGRMPDRRGKVSKITSRESKQCSAVELANDLVAEFIRRWDDPDRRFTGNISEGDDTDFDYPHLGYGLGMLERRVGYKGLARRSRDDAIVFVGAEEQLLVPHTLGEDTHLSIMEAIRDGWEGING